MHDQEQFKLIRVVYRAGRLVKEDHGTMPPNSEKFEDTVESQMDEAAAHHPEHGLIQLPEDQKPGPLDAMTYQILDDTMYNVLHELVMETFREEKLGRANTAAINLEKKALATLYPDSTSTTHLLDSDDAKKASKLKITTDIAYFDDEGNTSLIQDEKVPFPPIMEAVPEIVCPDCRLPRFPYPKEGEGSRQPEAGIEYCKKRVYVQTYPADIYNQIFVKDESGKSKGKKKAQELTPSVSQDSPNASPPASELLKKLLPTPSVKCPINSCTWAGPIYRISLHLQKHASKESGRAATTKAMARMQSANGYTSSGSRNATPAPTNGSNGRSSPNKRDIDEFDSDEPPQEPKKAKTAVNKKLKAPSMSKTSSQLSSSNLNHAETQASDDEFGDGDDDRDGDFGTISVDAKKKKKATPKISKKNPVKDPVKNGDATYPEKKKKAAASKTLAPTTKKSRPITPPDSKSKVKTEVNGKASKPKRGESESSQTLSSPN